MSTRVQVKLERRRDRDRKREVGIRLNLRGRACSLGGVWLSVTRTKFGEGERDAIGFNVEARWWGRA